MNDGKSRRPVLAGLRVLDISHQYAAGNACAILADLGADVLQVEDPAGNPLRSMMPRKGPHSMWWKVSQRGKKHITLSLSKPRGRELLLRLARDCDVLVENFRPGTLEKWGLGPADLERAGLNLTLVRISGFGQTGPYSPRPGFGTVAEAMSGFAHMTGFPDGPPVFPSTTVADGVASVWAVVGTLASLYASNRAPQGVEVVDVSLVESLLRLIPTQIAAYQQTGLVQTRPGNFSGSKGTLRDCYRTRDGRYYVISAIGAATIRNVLVGTEAPELVAVVETGLLSGQDTKAITEFLVRCNNHIHAWSAARDYAEVTAALTAADAVHAPVYSAAEIVDDPHLRAREAVVTVPDEELGEVAMQGIVPKFPGRDHRVGHPGRAKGHDNEEVYRGLGLTPADLAALREDGII